MAARGHHGLRALDELAAHLDADGLPDRRLTNMLAGVRATAWEQIVAGNQDRLPTVRVAGSRSPTPPVPAPAVMMVTASR